MPPETQTEILKAVATFDSFNPDNDPWKEHDCAVMDTAGHQIIWKLDYFDLGMQFQSSDPSDPAVTIRVLTIMLAAEY